MEPMVHLEFNSVGASSWLGMALLKASSLLKNRTARLFPSLRYTTPFVHYAYYVAAAVAVLMDIFLFFLS